MVHARAGGAVDSYESAEHRHGIAGRAGPVRVEERLPADYDWTKAESINLSVDGPTAHGVRVDVERLLAESGDHSSGSYLFGKLGWMDATDVERENQESFLTVCTPEP